MLSGDHSWLKGFFCFTGSVPSKAGNSSASDFVNRIVAKTTTGQLTGFKLGGVTTQKLLMCYFAINRAIQATLQHFIVTGF